MEHKNFINYPSLVEIARNRNGKSIWEIDGLKEALPALEAQRKRDLEDWMAAQGIDLVVFPANGDVGKADLDTNDESAKHALQNGVKYSNGNRAIRHMGVPTVSVTMGLQAGSKMPLNLTFAAGAESDQELLQYAYAYEQQTQRRVRPPVTPALETDAIDHSEQSTAGRTSSDVELTVSSAKNISETKVRVEGSLSGGSSGDIMLQAFVDGKQAATPVVNEEQDWYFEAEFVPFEPQKALYGGVGEVVGNVNIIVLAHSASKVVGRLVRIDQKALMYEGK